MWKEAYIKKFGEKNSTIPYYFTIGVDIEALYKRCVEENKTWEELLDIKNRKY